MKRMLSNGALFNPAFSVAQGRQSSELSCTPQQELNMKVCVAYVFQDSIKVLRMVNRITGNT